MGPWLSRKHFIPLRFPPAAAGVTRGIRATLARIPSQPIHRTLYPSVPRFITCRYTIYCGRPHKMIYTHVVKELRSPARSPRDLLGTGMGR